MNFKKGAAALLTAAALILTITVPVNASSYTVVKNDTIYTISQTFNTSMSTIMTSNKLSGSMIYPGQVLTVPGTDYTVKSGDSLYLIAQRAGIPLSTLRKANNKWDDMIYIGQKLIIPIGNSGNSSVAQPVISYSSYELDLLARLITAEAVGEPYQAKLAVGAAVINRVQDSRFPNTLYDVIYQVDHGYYQFTPVLNGWINKPATEDSIKAAREALNGADPTNGALYYFDNTATNQWLLSKPVALKVGKMIFSY